jgi:hypothetical protein
LHLSATAFGFFLVQKEYYKRQYEIYYLGCDNDDDDEGGGVEEKRLLNLCHA